MKKILLQKITALGVLVSLLSACKKNYITGGIPEDVNIYKNTSTYDVLKSTALYDTLVQVIDAAGLKDKVNEQGTTFFAPSDYSILNYLSQRTIFVQNAYNQNAKFALDSLVYYVKNNVKGTRDSLLMYLVHQPLTYSALSSIGALYPTGLNGNTVAVSYEYTKDVTLGYSSLVSSVPQVVYFTQLWRSYTITPSTPASAIPLSVGVRTLCKTSGITTQNGIMNALENSHVLFFYGTKQ
ncbi:MAG: fasciclin domain-containing protein [Williamsia sp.]|nr:fasciclin domain-containing protein [Williamsia sp.]